MTRQSTKHSFESIQVELADPDYKLRKEVIKHLMRYYRKQAFEPLLTMVAEKILSVRLW